MPYFGIKKNKKNKRDLLIQLIPQNAAKILDVGCATGDLTAGFKERGAQVVGLERCAQSCQEAKSKLSKVFLADIENFDIPYPQEYFDCILYADVLEHLVDPLAILKKHREYLKSDGFVIASIPNVRYYKLIIRLVCAGVWDYMNSGILDRTHLRFFTLTNIKELFLEAGYEIIALNRNQVASNGSKFLNFILFNKLKEFLVYQYFIKAKKSDSRSLVISKRVRLQF